jgi:hypothetical protein
MPHDDWLTQSLFIKESVEIMENNNNCNLCCANSILESTGDPINKSLPSYLDAEKEWKILRGDKYIRLLGGRINFQAYSAVICNWHILKNMGAYRYPYCLDQGITKKLDILPDEGFVFQFLLSSIGSIAITNKIVSVRGQPPHSYSSSTSWQKVAGQALFMLMFNIYSSNLNGKYANVVKNRAKYWLIFYYPVERFNIKILKHYEYSFTAIGLMLASYLYSLLTRNYFSILLKIMFRTIKDKGIIYFLVKIIKLIKEKKLDII